MKNFGKRSLSMLCALTMLLSLMAMIVPGAFADSTTTNEIDAIPSEHLAAVRYYSDFATEAGKTAYVDDSDAYGGKAVCYSKANFDGGDFIGIHRYESATSADASIAQLFKADLNVNQGYHIYKFSYDVPAETTENGVVYIMPNWQLNSSQLCKDIYAYAGQTVELYFSMKVTGPSDEGYYSVSVDRVALATVCESYASADGSECTLCGKVLKEEEQGAKLPITFLADDIRLAYAPVDSVVADSVSKYGKAVMLSYEKRFATGDKGLYNAMIRTGGLSVGVYTYNGNDSVRVGGITIDQLQKNAAAGNYVEYTFQSVQLIPSAGNFYMYMFDCWGLQTRFTKEQLDIMQGKLLDVTISMRVTGDVTNTGNPPAYYIDSITFALSAPDEINSIHSEHLVNVRDYSNFAVDANEGTTYVDDADAHNSKAVCFSKAKLTDHPFISIYRYDVASGLGEGAPELKIGSLTLDELKVNEGYQIYKFTYDVPAATTQGNTFYIMSNWQLNSAQFCRDFAAYAGKTVEVYLSMKVTGPSADGYYSVYVDRVALASVCKDYASDDGSTCTKCGKLLNVAEGEYAITVLAPSGTVYPYQDCVKEYLLDENIDIMAHYVAGTIGYGDASIAPLYIIWSDAGNNGITKYVVEYSTNEDYSGAITVTKETDIGDKKIAVYNLYKASTYYVRVTAYAGDAVIGQAESTFKTTDLGPRIMNIGGLYNVRDLGGYKTVDGKLTLQGLIFRGSEMDGGNDIALTDEGNAYMSNVLGIQIDLDLRGNSAKSPISSATKKAIGISAYLDAFTQKELYREVFSTLADANNYPVYIHCMGGADRTGTVCYLINALLGVSEEDLIRDYEMTSYSIFGERTKDFYAYKFPEFVAQLKSYEGDTLAEKTENYMLSIGVTEAEIANIRAILLDDKHVHTGTDYTYTDENVHSGICTECGEPVAEDHVWDDGVITVKPTLETEGEKTYTCTVCNGTKTEVLDKLDEADLTLTFLAEDITVPYYTAGLCDTKVDDADSQYGKAVKLSYEERYATGDAGLYKAMLYTPEQAMLIYSNDGSDTQLGKITGTEMQENAAAGQYVTYTFQGLDLSNQNFVYLFDWSVQTRFTEEQKSFFENKLVDMTVSMKVTGDVTGTDTADPPSYYIDCISYRIVEEIHFHSCPEYTYVDEEQHTGTCSECGEPVTEDHVWDEGVVTVEPTKETLGEKSYTCTVCNGTKIQVLDKLTENEIDLIALEHLVSMRDHSCFAVDPNEGTQYVDDDTAYNGKAVCYSRAKLAGFPGISINRYDVASGYADGAPEMKIGNLSLSELKIDQGYRVYRFIYHIPAETTEGNTFYIMSNWQLNSSEFCKDFAAYAGKTVEVLLSMKITGPNAEGFYSVFVDRVALATLCEDHPSEDGLTCTLCGGSLVEEPEKLPITILAEDILLPYAPTDSVVSDSKSQYGKAAVISYKKRYSTGDKGLINSVIRSSGLSLSMNTYDGEDSTLVGRITFNQLQKNAAAGKYTTYTFYNVKLIPAKGSAYVYMFDCWGLQVRFTEKQLDALRGKRVDVTVSLRVTGDVSSTSNPPAYYIDCIQITEASGKSCGHEDSTWTFVDDKEHNFSCAICGKAWNSEHTWDEGTAVEGAPEGLKLYTCTGCKKSAIMGEEALPAIFLADNFNLPYGIAFGCDSVVDDPDSQFGKAVKISYADRYATGDKGLYQHLLFADNQEMRLYSCDGNAGTHFGAIDGAQLRENAAAGKYVTYQFKGVDMTGASFIYIFECWGFQVRFSQEQLSAMQDKLVDVSVSMKVTGDPSGSGEAPAYYIESVSVAASEETKHMHTYTDYTAVDETQHTSTCTICGEEKTENHKWDAGEYVKKATTEENGEILYTCTVCGGTKTKIVNKLSNSNTTSGDNGGPISNEILIWAIAVGVADLAIVIFIIAMIKKRNRK